MDREQMVEEMAKREIQIINEDDCATRDNICQCQKCKYSDISFPDCQFWILADKLIEDNYRQIPDGAVVLTKEELVRATEEGYVFDTTKGNKINIIEMAQEQARKETARKILQTLNGILNIAGEINKKHLSAIAKDFSVENGIGVEVE